MKQYTPPFIIMVLSGLLCSMVHAQEPVWLKQYGNSNANRGLQLAYDGQGGVYGVGRVGAPALVMDDTTVTVLGSQDILLAKWDTSGVVIWARTAGGVCQPTEHEGGGGIVHDGLSGHVIISGQFDCHTTYFGAHVLNGSQNNGRDRFIAVYDSAGECLWARSANGFDVSSLRLLVDSSSNVFAFGWARTAGVAFQGSPTITLPTGGFIAKYASDGTLLDARRVVVNGELNRADWVTSGTWALAGSAKPNATLYGQALTVHSAQHDGFVARTDTTGTVEWVTMFPSNGSANVFRTAVLPDGKIAVSGYFVEDLLLPQDTLNGASGVWTYFIAVLNAGGEVEWALPIIAEHGAAMDIKADLNGDILLHGRYDGNLWLGVDTLAPYASANSFVARFSPSGECRGAWGFGRTSFGTGSILPTDHGLYLATEFDSTLVLGSHVVTGSYVDLQTTNLTDLLIARFDSLSGFTGVQTLKSSGVERLHIYANPNNGTCSIELPEELLHEKDLVLRILDAQGRVVQQTSLHMHEGRVQLDIRAQAKGTYVAEVGNGKVRYTGRIVFE